MPSIFQHHIEVPQSAIDANGHVNNVSYVQWVQDAAAKHSSAQATARRSPTPRPSGSTSLQAAAGPAHPSGGQQRIHTGSPNEEP
ncbi:hypothetical protein [Geoalkalibacter sp.]|uniref:hypothetical protein n=1 Tax=Geoalkalibacter sp. TaxID=3041440 RepID=UPI003D10E72F